jgi:hypothetical protein
LRAGGYWLTNGIEGMESGSDTAVPETDVTLATGQIPELGMIALRDLGLARLGIGCRERR